MLQKSIDVARNMELDFVWLGVWENNLKAIGFYVNNGFIQFGSHEFKFGSEMQTDLILKLTLGEQ